MVRMSWMIMILAGGLLAAGCPCNCEQADDAGEPDNGVPEVDAGDTPEPETTPSDVKETVSLALVVDDLGDGAVGAGTEEDPYRDLQFAIDQCDDGGTILIKEGTYSATPQPYADPGCGNCPDATFYDGSVATRGFLVTGKSVHLEGVGQQETILVTNAGYGLLFDDAGDSSVQNLKVTGGVRDADGKATDAGIVVLHTKLLVEDVSVVGNDNLYTGPEPDPVVGVGGIFGREGSDLTIKNCVVQDNSWDGITLYRGLPGDASTSPVAHVEGNRVGCNSQCVNPRGRGAGIATTWDSSMVAIGNEVFRYWKGIGAFGDSTMILHNNVVRDQGGWGVIVTGYATMYAYNNVVTRNGTTGMSAWNVGTKGAFVNNIIYANGTSPDEWVGKKAGLWMNTTAPAFTLRYNLVFENADEDACFGGLPDPNPEPCIPLDTVGTDGNIAGDPLFLGPNDFHLKEGSPAIDAGDPTLFDPDESRSDMGIYGGTHGLQ